MARISLVEQYDNKDVIQQIYLLKTATDGWEERISATEQTANNALTTAEGFDMRIDAVEDANTALDTRVDGFDTRITTAQTTADTAIGNVDTLDRQVDTRIAGQEVTALDVASAGTGAYAVTAHKQNGNITSNSFNISKVVSATIGEGSANNSIYLQLNLSDGTTVRTNDTVISITGVEEDIHVTSIVLEDAPDAHTIKAIFTYNNGQSISSNTLTYDYPDIASSSMPGLVMGNDAAGGVQVDGQGRMSVVGWDDFATDAELEDVRSALATDIVNAKAEAADNLRITETRLSENKVGKDVWASKNVEIEQSIENEASARTSADQSLGERIDATVEDITSVDARVDTIEDELGAEGQAGTIRNEIALLKAKDTTLQGNIDAVDTRCDNISSTVSDQGTMLSAQATAIQENTTAISGKQDKLTFDQEPTKDSQNPVTSGGVYSKLSNVVTRDEISPSLREYDYATQLAKVGYLDRMPEIYQDRVTIQITPAGTSGTREYSETVAMPLLDKSKGWTACEVKLYSMSGYLDTNDIHVDSVRLLIGSEELTISGTIAGTGNDITAEITLMNIGSIYPSDALTIGSFGYGTLATQSGAGGWIRHNMIYESTANASMFAFIWSEGDDIDIAVDTAISASSTNPVQNKVISAALDLKASTATTDAITQELAGKQDKLTPGTGISIVGGVISINLANANGVSF